MRKIMKRGFCLFLVAVLLAGLVPYAFADEAKPTDVSEDAAEPTEETTAPPETTVPSESTEPPSEATEPPVTTEATEPDADPVEDDMEDDRLLSDSISTYASTVSNVLLFDQASPNYTTVLKSQISVTYQPNGTDSIKTAYIKNLGWHFARYNNTPYEDDPIYCIEPCKNYAASTSGNYMDQDLGVSGSGSSRGSNVWYAMPSSYRQAIALTLLYSKQLWNSNYSVKTTAMANNPNVSTRIASKGYAIAGVEFTYLKVADITTFQNQETTQVLYGFHKTDAANLLKAIGLENGADRCAEADSLDADRYFYPSDTLNKALAQSLEANSTTVKNALEAFIRNGCTAMAPTSEVGKTSAKDLPVGLYLLVETKVPEMVTSTTNPFFVSLPMTTVTGNDNSASQNGGTAWNCQMVQGRCQ